MSIHFEKLPKYEESLKTVHLRDGTEEENSPEEIALKVEYTKSKLLMTIAEYKLDIVGFQLQIRGLTMGYPLDLHGIRNCQENIGNYMKAIECLEKLLRELF